jgi:hypothetical protein
MALVTKLSTVWMNGAPEAHYHRSRQISTAPRVVAVRAGGFTTPCDFHAALAPDHVAWIVAALSGLLCAGFAVLAVGWPGNLSGAVLFP